MPLKVKHLDERRGVYSEASGHLTGDEPLQAVTEVNSPAIGASPVLYTFFDFNDVTRVDISNSQLRRAAAISIRASAHQAVGRIVAIYAKDDFPFALARMWQVFVDQTGWATRVFRDRSEATAWVRELAIVRFGIQIAEL